ncbi:hypothetical protein NI18_00265 [Sphingomonas sp. Ant20]|jgi:uncharacterized membrane protein|nr:hypothetical protein NI18_00265 [Sphingomonas sp. Ant20]
MTLDHTTAAVSSVAHGVSVGFEVAAVATIVAVALGAVMVLGRALRRGADWTDAMLSFRTTIGRGVLLGLELLVAADIIGTIAVTPTFRSLGILALIIAIRTFLSASLSVEIEGTLPWRRTRPPN